MGREARARQAALQRKRRTQIAVTITATFAVIVVVVTILVTRGSGDSPGPAAAGGFATSATKASVGKQFPDFTLTAPGGTAVTKASIAGKKTLIWFVDAATCPTCPSAAAQMGKVLDGLGSGAPHVLAVFVNPAESETALTEWRTTYGRPGWTVALDPGSRLAQQIHLQCLDTRVIVDEKGTILDADPNPVTSGYLQLLREKVTA
ncbi:redoxin family protein [Amycolatopsis sp. H6(2020)]|nr:redoxin family protein [Amycolatopsis sp. H6(2020)]